MRKSLFLGLVVGVFMASGCAMKNSPVEGGLYTGVTHSGVFTGGTIDNNVSSFQSGSSSCTSILGLIAFGDCSEEAAKLDGGITNVNSVVHKSTNILFGLFSHYTTIVNGE